MHVLRIAALAAVLLAAWTTGAVAQESSSQTVAATGTIFRPIVLEKNSDLSFGTVVRPTAGSGTVVIDPLTGDRTITGQGALLGGATPPSRAAFTVTGEGGQTLSITVPPTLVMTRSGGAETITVDLSPSAVGGTLSSALANEGTLNFGVGAEVPISNTTASGEYTGAFTVTVQYN